MYRLGKIALSIGVVLSVALIGSGTATASVPIASRVSEVGQRSTLPTTRVATIGGGESARKLLIRLSTMRVLVDLGF
jgi:hypothetical protein